MADKDMRVEPGVALEGPDLSDDDEVITSNSEMPPAEPGHDVAKAKEGKVFDPNAAARWAAGAEPWLQDSEAINPAHWPSVPDPVKDLKVAIQKKEREVKKLQDELKELKKS